MESQLASALRRSGITVPRAGERVVAGEDGFRCPVLSWAASGAMSLTGWPDRPPQWPAGDVIGALTGTARLLEDLARTLGAELAPLDIGALLTGRAAVRGGSRRGRTSVGGASRILRAADGWIAFTLSRPEDAELLPALGLGPVPDDGPGGSEPDGVPDGVWDRLEVFTGGRPAGRLMEEAQRLGLPAAQVTTSEGDILPWSIRRLGEPVPAGPRRLRVVDFSAMWAGPLCAHLLGRCGAEVVKVEHADRPDGARRGDPWLFEQLHAGHRQVILDFGSGPGRRALGELVSAADVLIEASRPRALGHLGLSPARFLGDRPGRTWVSITGHGRVGPRSNWVAFGDDGAAAGGLVASGDPRGPVFCSDAIADPVTGLSAATGALASMAAGGGHLVDCSMRAASAFAHRFGTCDRDHAVEHRGGSWFVAHGDNSQLVAGPRREQTPSTPSTARPTTGSSR